MSKLYLMGAGQTFDMERFEYVRELVDGLDCVLEFETYIGDISVNGVDIIRWNENGKIVDFKVMIRPLAGHSCFASKNVGVSRRTSKANHKKRGPSEPLFKNS